VPQTPNSDSPRPRYAAGPAPYVAVDVAFQNAVDNVHLAGTLTVPRGAVNAPAVLLSQGLGLAPFDRDYPLPSAPALKSFLAIADALSRNGIVVLRVDDRGAGGSYGQKNLSSVQQLAGDPPRAPPSSRHDRRSTRSGSESLDTASPASRCQSLRFVRMTSHSSSRWRVL
jgi:hypothetical protein